MPADRADGTNIVTFDKEAKTYLRQPQTDAAMKTLFASNELGIFGSFFLLVLAGLDSFTALGSLAATSPTCCSPSASGRACSYTRAIRSSDSN